MMYIMIIIIKKKNKRNIVIRFALLLLLLFISNEAHYCIQYSISDMNVSDDCKAQPKKDCFDGK